MGSRVLLNSSLISMVIIAALALTACQKDEGEAPSPGSDLIAPTEAASSETDQYNFVKSVKVNGYDVVASSRASLSDLPDFFWDGGTVTEGFVDDSEACGYQGDRFNIQYPGRSLVLRLNEPDIDPKNKDLDVAFPRKQSDGDSSADDIVLPSKDFSSYRKYSFGASLYLSWDNADQFSDLVQIGGQTIKLGMSFEQFKKAFPASGNIPGNDVGDDEGNNTGGKAFYVGIGDAESDLSDVFYQDNVSFVFKDGKLVRFGMNEGYCN